MVAARAKGKVTVTHSSTPKVGTRRDSEIESSPNCSETQLELQVNSQFQVRPCRGVQ